MKLNAYQERATQFATYPREQALVYTALGLTGEAGEFADKVKKIIRDKGGVVSADDRAALMAELGDVLWYLQEAAGALGCGLEEIAIGNIDKLASRKLRGVLSGSGDNR